ncbi:MAG: MurT ligase domain-containing protein [Acetobacter sp.]|nr:MurT ligase domain-containing protein [Bacteroides sp.]MCM1340710.1 MurT ligase domain-containing protein [Acetobacter sp.]MCM1433049.1 MurT ligase domain-containing protein [Clostridiales bacterium]
MRVILSCIVCRLVHFILQKLGRGATTLPGRIALKVKRNVLTDLSKNVKVIIVTGTNGKTTSCRIIEEGLKQAGKTYFINKSGANLITGITSSFIMNSSIGGKNKYDYAIVECDENAFREVSRYIRADVVLVTNVFRDQLDRYGEVTHTLNAIKESVKNLPDAVICLDADCSLTYSMSREITNKIITFGVNVPFDEKGKAPEISDAKYCIFCKNEYEYTYHTYGHLGGFICKKCGYSRPSPDFAVTSVEELKQNHSIVVADFNGSKNIVKVNIGGAYNVYNAIGCAAALFAAGVDEATIIKALESFNGAFGRMEQFKCGENKVNVILVKNPAGFSQTMSFLKTIDDDFTMILSLNDNAADGRDISWIWDVDFDGIFNKTNLKTLYVTGKRCYDMAIRVKYEGVGDREIKIIENEDYEKLVDVATSQGRDVYIVPTYTSMMTMRPVIAKRLGGKDFWE